MIVIYEVKTNKLTNYIEHFNNAMDAIVRCAEARFQGLQADAYEVTIFLDSNTCEREKLY